MAIDFPVILMQYVCLLFSLCVHEAAHAAMANRCGDPTARLMGRLSLNPLKHIDPLGTVIMPLLMMLTRFPFLFGFAKPVPFNPRNLNNIRRDPVLIALAGPGSNLLLIIAFTFVLRITVLASGITTVEELVQSPAAIIALYMIVINLVLMLFNCIPLPPLDGHHVLAYFLPPAAKQAFQQIGPFGLLIAILIGGRLIHPPLVFLRNLVVAYGLFGFNL